MIPRQAIEKANKRDFMRKPQRWFPHHNEESLSVAFIESKGKEWRVTVDYDDLPKVMVYRWYLKAGYAVTSIGGKRVVMHHLIVGKPPKGMEVDHINQNILENNRANLRVVAANDNKKNQEGKGYRKRGNSYEAYIGLGGKQKSLGTFKTEAEAQAAYKNAQQERINSIAA